MIYKNWTEPVELVVLRLLKKRTSLPDSVKKYYQFIEKGFTGEKLLDTRLKQIDCECYILHDLVLKANGTTFQVDTLIITSQLLYLLDIKNYEGDYNYDSGKFLSSVMQEIKSPLTQLERSENLLRLLIQNLGFTIPIAPYVVFINPEFTLYNAPQNERLIFPTQINRFIRQIELNSNKLTAKHKLLAEKLVSSQIRNNFSEQNIPHYEYEKLKKGISCSECTSFSIDRDKQSIICKDCGHKELIKNAVLRSIEEYKILFPEKLISTVNIYDWCGNIVSKKQIRTILGSYYKLVGFGRWSYYE